MDRNANIGRVVAVCVSNKRGTKKHVIPEGILKENYGLLQDAHASEKSSRQVSLLSIESMEKMGSRGISIEPGIFAENITTQGIDLTLLKPGVRIALGEEAIVEVTQIGKECHTRCEIYTQIGECIMPEEGVFAKVLQGGKVKHGDRIAILKIET